MLLDLDAPQQNTATVSIRKDAMRPLQYLSKPFKPVGNHLHPFDKNWFGTWLQRFREMRSARHNQRDGRIEGYQQQCMDAEQAPDREQTTTLSQDLGQGVGQQEDQPG